MTRDEAKQAEVEAAIVQALAERGHTCNASALDNEYFTRRAIEFSDGIQIGLRLEFMPRMGAYQLTVGHRWRSRRPFREPKAGFKYGEIASFIVSLAESQRRETRQEQAAEVAEKHAQAVRKLHGLERRGAVTVREKNGMVCIHVDAPASDEQIAAMVAAARGCGLLGAPVEEPDEDEEMEEDEEDV